MLREYNEELAKAAEGVRELVRRYNRISNHFMIWYRLDIFFQKYSSAVVVSRDLESRI